MIAAEEERLKEREEHLHQREQRRAKEGKKKIEEPQHAGEHKTEGEPRPKTLP